MMGSVTHQSKENLPAQVQNIFFKHGDEPSGRYWPDNGRRSDKNAQKSPFFRGF